MKKLIVRRKNPKEMLPAMLNKAEVLSIGGSDKELIIKFRKGIVPDAALVNQIKTQLPEYEVTVEDIPDEINPWDRPGSRRKH